MSNLKIINEGSASSAKNPVIDSSADELVLDKISITNSQNKKSIIESKGILTITDSEISENKAQRIISIKGGGAKTISGCKFNKNEGKSSSPENVTQCSSIIELSGQNAAGGKLEIQDSSFTNNEISRSAVYGNIYTDITVSDSVFENNKNSGIGHGGSTVRANGPSLSVSGTSFIRNKSNGSGAAICIDRYTISKSSGKLTVKKGLKKGAYKVKVKVKATGNANYKASAVKTVTFTIKVN